MSRGRRHIGIHAALRPRSTAWRTSAGAAVLVTLLASCADDRVPRLRFPQVEQATEAMHGGGERYRDHRTCMQSSQSVQDLIQCMAAARWNFVGSGALYPESECWQARDQGELDRLVSHCFVRAPEHP